MKRSKVDNIDLRILKILQNKGKVTNIQLSNEIGLSPAPTLERVKKLEQNGIIKGYHAKVNATALDLQFQALIQISLYRQAKNAVEEFKKAVTQIDEIIECYMITGGFDFIIKVMTNDITTFEKLLSEKLSLIEVIGNMQTMVILSTEKSSKVVPADYSTSFTLGE